jgi:hypothetical protein
MNFLTNLKKQEQEKYRTPSWSQAVAELCRFIRRYLREAEAESALRVKPDLLRVDKVLLDRLTIFLHGQTVIVTPLSMNDSRAPTGGGCVVMQSTNGVTYNLLWDGSTSAVRDHWKIVRAEDHSEANKVQLDHRLTVFFSGSLQDDMTSLDESRLDEALLKLFGLITDPFTGTVTDTAAETPTVAEAPTVREEPPLHMSTPVTPLFQQSVRYHANFNGRRASS